MFIKLARKIYCVKHGTNFQNNAQYIEYLKSHNEIEALEIVDNATNECDIANMFAELDEYSELMAKYGLIKVAGNGSDSEKIRNILNWLTANTYYCGIGANITPDDSLKILKASYQRDFKRAINCRQRAILLTDICIALGIKAYPIMLLSKSSWCCHFIVHVYISELGKWVAYDPSFGVRFLYENKPIDVVELRKMLLVDKQIKYEGFTLNGTGDCLEIYINGFLRSSLSNIGTWKNNIRSSKERREYCALVFNCKLPIGLLKE